MSQARLPSGCFASSLPPRPYARTLIAAFVPWQLPRQLLGGVCNKTIWALWQITEAYGEQQLAVCLPSMDCCMHIVLERQTSKQYAAMGQGRQPESA